MRAVIQRVLSASVEIDGKTTAEIDKGFLVLLGIEHADNESDIEWLAAKIAGLRVFSDQNEKMNLSLKDINGEILVVSQFTLFASTRKGNRPSFIRSARPETAIPLYEKFVKTLNLHIENEVKTGEFGAMMKITLLNDGPVTIIIDSKNRE